MEDYGFEPRQGQEYFLKSLDPLWAPPYLLSNWVLVFLPQSNKRPGLEANRSLSPSTEAEVKDVWRWTFDPLVCLNGTDKDDFTSTFI